MAYGLTSCSGHQIRYFDNPFSEYGIKTVHIRPIENNSHYPFIGHSLTVAILELYRRYDNLEVKISDDLNADAIVIGVVSQVNRKRIGSMLSQSTSDFYTENNSGISNSIGDRDDFVVKQTGYIDLNLKLMMIQRPTEADIDYAIHSRSDKSIPQATYIFKEDFELDSIVNFSIRETHNESKVYDQDLGGVVNYTNSKYNLDRTIDGLVDRFSVILEKRVFNVF